ncbi:MAG: glycosyltransferase family 4 protein [Cyanobacteria bacterium P01_A01_bin.135]
MHIAWLGKKLPFCGNVTYGRETTNALLDRGHRVSFFHFSASEGDPESSSQGNDDFSEVSLPYIYKSQIYTIPSLRSSRILKEALRQLRPDVVHASLALSPLDFKLPEICAELGLPLVATFHPAFDAQRRNFTSNTQQLTYQIYAPFLAEYHRVIVFSEVQRQLLHRLGVPSAKISVIPNGVDASKYSPGITYQKAQFQAERLFVYQGRLSLEKNVEALLRAWRHSDMGPVSKLVIMGGGPLEAMLKALYGEDPSIAWLGFVADERRRIEILRAADVFILPSLVEGLSLSLLEAMACQTACIATDVGADGEVLERGAGIVLTAQRVATQLQTLLPLCRDQPELTRRLGQLARERVMERYTLKDNITQLEALYQQLQQRVALSQIR